MADKYVVDNDADAKGARMLHAVQSCIEFETTAAGEDGELPIGPTIIMDGSHRISNVIEVNWVEDGLAKIIHGSGTTFIPLAKILAVEV